MLVACLCEIMSSARYIDWHDDVVKMDVCFEIFGPCWSLTLIQWPDFNSTPQEQSNYCPSLSGACSYTTGDLSVVILIIPVPVVAVGLNGLLFAQEAAVHGGKSGYPAKLGYTFNEKFAT